MGVVGFTHFFQNIDESGGCPTITFGALSADTFFAGSESQATFTISPAAADRYDITVVSGSLPANTEPVGQAAGGTIALTGHSQHVFGKSTFTLRATDNITGCYGEQEFTIEVKHKGENTTPVPVEFGTAQLLVPISGLPPVYGIGVELESCKVSMTTEDGLSFITSYLIGSPEGNVYFITANDLTGSNITDARIIGSPAPLISTGSEPYTGDWQGVNEGAPAGDFSIFNGEGSNGAWYVELGYETDNAVLVSVEFIFKPI